MMSTKEAIRPRRSALNACGELIATLVALAAASVSGALVFAVAEDGYWTFKWLAARVIAPGIVALVILAAIAWFLRWRWLGHGIVAGAWIGAVSTIGLEVVRLIGFHAFHSMPGDLPKLMGVLMTQRFMLGPDTLSNVLGYVDHYWNGAAFGIIYVLLVGKRAWWAGLIYGAVIGTLFLDSPVVRAIGAGHFGSEVGPKFVVTVYLAHLAFGGLLGWLTSRSSWVGPSLPSRFLRADARRGSSCVGIVHSE